MSQTVDGFILGETLGSGKQGKVKIGKSATSDQLVAVKIMEPSQTNQKNLRREVDTMLEAGDHPNIVKLLHVNYNVDFFGKDGSKSPKIILVQELQRMGELFDFMMYTGSFPEHIAKTYFNQLMSAVEYCHKLGIFHRDLKPENLLLDEDFVLKVADFGLATSIHHSGDSNLLRTECGTRGYMAPEVMTGGGYEGAPVDVWSCGVILFIMLSGFPPFQIANESDWWFRQLKNKKYAQFWSAHMRSARYSDEAKDLLNRIFSVDATERITASDVMRHPFMKGGIEQDLLQEELSQRRIQVVEAKRKELEELRRKKAEEKARREQRRLRREMAANRRRQQHNVQQQQQQQQFVQQDPQMMYQKQQQQQQQQQQQNAYSSLNDNMDVDTVNASVTMTSDMRYHIRAHRALAASPESAMKKLECSGESLKKKRVAAPAASLKEECAMKYDVEDEDEDEESMPMGPPSMSLGFSLSSSSSNSKVKPIPLMPSSTPGLVMLKTDLLAAFNTESIKEEITTAEPTAASSEEIDESISGEDEGVEGEANVIDEKIIESMKLTQISELEHPVPKMIAAPFALRYSHLYASCDAPQLMNRIQLAVQKTIKAASIEVSQSKYKVKVMAPTDIGLVQMNIRVYAPHDQLQKVIQGLEEYNQLHFVDVKRIQGDIMKFQTLYKRITKELEDLITIPPEAETYDTVRPVVSDEQKIESVDDVLGDLDGMMLV